MSHRMHSGAVVPAGLVVEQVGNAGEVTEIAVRSPRPYSRCPTCGVKAAAVHSHYSRRLGDLPLWWSACSSCPESTAIPVLDGELYQAYIRRALRQDLVEPWRAEPAGSVSSSFILAWRLVAAPERASLTD